MDRKTDPIIYQVNGDRITEMYTLKPGSKRIKYQNV